MPIMSPYYYNSEKYARKDKIMAESTIIRLISEIPCSSAETDKFSMSCSATVG